MIRFLSVLIVFLISYEITSAEVIIDSDMTFEESVEGTKAPQNVINDLVLLNVKYYSFDNKLHQGQLLVNKEVETDVKEIFDTILKIKFPINKVIPIVKYGWDDDSSMADNNTSAFCYRFVAGTSRLSNHALGRAIDINPFNNPVIYENGRISPEGAIYNSKMSYTFTKDNPIVIEFLKRGWRWGGNFESFKDYHHFDKKE
ncbi:M15 family peptidase [Bacteroidetes/Chlorobi group bacterium ChocPot_Mid]|jgi:hypothetical protein|nr:MAG: M15 family peptidase [Bacteroidetes/Chlorobi group bacterium ChocPot_Mid]